ncbi:MAG: methyl-accepting chemotaxis protein [Lachnospiraceae bacterium]|nr:methyl-accepting chemotaxis protein [Lachnospiraceae bacterium]
MNTNTNEDKVQDNILSENSNNSFIEVLESYEESNTSSSNHQPTDKLKTSKIPLLKTITFKLLFSYAIPIICIIALGLGSYNKASNAIIKQYTNSVSQTTNMLQKYITMVISSEMDKYKAYLVDKDAKAYFSGNLDSYEEGNIRNAINKTLNVDVGLDTKLSDVYIISDDGKTLKSNGKATLPDNAYSIFTGFDVGKTIKENNTEWFVLGKDSTIDEALEIPDATYSMRIAHNMQKNDQCLFVDIDEAYIRSIMNELDPGKNGYVLFITSDGKEFYSNEEVSLDSTRVYGTSFYEKAIVSEETSGSDTVTINGKSNLFIYSKIEAGNTMVATLIPEKNIISQASAIKRLSIILMIVSTIVALFFGLRLSRHISKVVNYILHQLRKVANGDFTVTLKSKANDEFGLLCEGVNRTVYQMRELIEEVNAVSMDLNHAASHVAETAATFTETSADIQNAVSEIEVGINMLDTGSADCLKQMDSLSGKINNVSTNTQTIEELTNQTGKTILQGIQSVNILMESATSTTAITHNVISAIEELEKKSNSISNIINAINDISEETKLLSLNASIEAARAGDAGRGFAIVADEIRKLSEQCMDAAGQISVLIDEIVDKTGNVCNIAREAEAAVFSQTGVVSDTTTSFRQIEIQIENLIKALETIVLNVQTMDGSRNETLNSIESISDVSAKTAASSSTVYSKTQTQLSATNELEHSAQQLQAKADHLIDVLHNFKL